MADPEVKNCGKILQSDALKMVRPVSRRDFMKFSVCTAAGAYLAALTVGCGGSSSSLSPGAPSPGASSQIAGYQSIPM